MNETRVLARGGLNLLLGRPGAGQSALALALAAEVVWPLILDPLPARFAGGARRELAAFLAWAERRGVTVLATASRPEEAKNALLLAKAAFLVWRDPADEARGVLVPLKHPTLTRPLPFIVAPSGPDGSGARIAWGRKQSSRPRPRIAAAH
jgi:hypothetical protein